MSLEYIGKFAGSEEIIEVEESGKTPLGEPVFIVKVKLPEGKEELSRTYTKPTLDAVVTEKASDWNAFREAKFNHIVNKMTELAIEYGISGEEMDPLLMAAGRNFATMLDKAVYKKWFGNTDDFVPGGTSFHGFTLLEAHNTINGGIDIDTKGEGSDTADKA